MSERQKTILTRIGQWLPILTGIGIVFGYVMLFANLPTRVQALENADKDILKTVTVECSKNQETRERMIRIESKMDMMLEIINNKKGQ